MDKMYLHFMDKVARISWKKEGYAFFASQYCRHYMTGILPIRRKTQHNQSLNLIGKYQNVK